MLVYVAASLARVSKAKEIARLVRDLGHVPVSTWHGVVQEGDVDPVDVPDRATIAATCVREVLSADAVIAYTAGGEPCGTFTEIGIALGAGKPVVWCLPPTSITHDNVRRTNVFDSAPGVHRVTSSENLEATIRAVAEGFRA